MHRRGIVMSEENHVIKLRVNTALLAKATRWVAPAADTREKYFRWVNNVRFEFQRSDKSVGHFDAANGWERMQVKSDYVLTLVATDRVLMSWATVPVEVEQVQIRPSFGNFAKVVKIEKTDLSAIWSIHAEKLVADIKTMSHNFNARHDMAECRECATDFVDMRIASSGSGDVVTLWGNSRYKSSDWTKPGTSKPQTAYAIPLEFPRNWGTVAARFGMGVQTEDYELPRVLAFNPDYLVTLASAYRASCGATSAPLKFRIEGSSPHSSKTPVAIAASDEHVMRSAALMSMKLKEGNNADG